MTARSNRAVVDAPETIYTWMTRVLGHRVTSEADAYRLVEKGLAASVVKHLIGALEIPATLIAPETTIRRRYKDNSAFSSAESERALRVARVYAEAQLLFRDEAATLEWFRKPTTLVPGERAIAPMELAATDTGARLIESKLRRTAYGLL